MVAVDLNCSRTDVVAGRADQLIGRAGQSEGGVGVEDLKHGSALLVD